MKQILLALRVCLLWLPLGVSAQQSAVITVENHTGGNIYLQPEDTTGYYKMEGERSMRELAIDAPCYFRFVDKDYGFHPLYVTPGARINILCDADGVHVSGTNAAENRFMREHPFVCLAPEGVVSYSREWQDYNNGYLKALLDTLDKAPLSEEFKEVHRLYWENAYLFQQLNGVVMANVFRPGGGSAVQLPEGYYDFLSAVKFDDMRMLWLPAWFKTMELVFDEREKQGMMPVSNDHYLMNYANAIGDETLRARFLVDMMALMLKKGYLDDFAAQLEEVRPFITDATAQKKLAELQRRHATLCEHNRNVARGTQMPVFEARTVDGKTYSLDDLRGKFVVLDFWFTGCVPCKAEMPYYDKLAEEMKGRDVCFVSVSLDTGNQLMAAWRKMMAEVPASSPVLHLNLPGGFKSDFVKTLNIASVPRMLLIDREGKVVEGYAKRPSDPKLKQQIESLLAE